MQVYEAINKSSEYLNQDAHKENMNLDKERQPRTHEEMSAEANELRPFFQ